MCCRYTLAMTRQTKTPSGEKAHVLPALPCHIPACRAPLPPPPPLRLLDIPLSPLLRARVLSNHGGFGILVSTVAKQTAAVWRLSDPSEVLAFLKRLVAWGESKDGNGWHGGTPCHGWTPSHPTYESKQGMEP